MNTTQVNCTNVERGTTRLDFTFCKNFINLNGIEQIKDSLTQLFINYCANFASLNGLQHCKNVECLTISSVTYTGLPLACDPNIDLTPMLVLPRLKTLQLDCCGFKEFPNLSALTTLETLYLRYCLFNHVDGKNIPPNVKTLDISNNKLTSLPAFDTCQGIIDLNFRDNCISTHIELIKLRDLKKLKAIHIYNNPLCNCQCGFDEKLAASLPECIEHIYGYQDIIYSIKAMMPAARQNDPFLKPSLQQQLIDSQKQLKESEQKVVSAENELLVCKNELQEQAQENQKLQNQILQMQNENLQLKHNEQTSQQNVVKKDSEIQLKDQQIQLNKQEIFQMESENQQLLLENQKVKQNFQTNEQEKDQLKKKLDDLKAAIFAQQQQNLQKDAQIKQMKEQLDLQLRCEQLQKENSAQLEQLKNKDLVVQERDLVVQDLQKKDQLEQKVDVLVNENQQMREQVKEVNSQVAQSNAIMLQLLISQEQEQ